MKVLIIKWRDSAQWPETFDRDDVPGLMVVLSAGIFVREDKECVVISEDYWHEDRFRNTTSIPKNSIIVRREVKLSKQFMKDLEGRGADRE